MNRASETVADITYRANAIDGREIVVRLQRAPEAATLADAWARLVAIEPNVDPMSIEIEVRETLPTRRHAGENLRKDHEARGIGALLVQSRCLRQHENRHAAKLHQPSLLIVS
jgi:hypothetical protein